MGGICSMTTARESFGKMQDGSCFSAPRCSVYIFLGTAMSVSIFVYGLIFLSLFSLPAAVGVVWSTGELMLLTAICRFDCRAHC